MKPQLSSFSSIQPPNLQLASIPSQVSSVFCKLINRNKERKRSILIYRSISNKGMKENKEAASLGKSIIVPSVYELAKETGDSVPPRYLHSDLPTSVDPDIASSLQIPVVSIESLVNGDLAEISNFHSACQEWGFFQVVDHGVSSTLIQKVKVDIQDWFNIPLEEKKKFWQTPGDFEGFGQSFVHSEEQKLDWADKFSLVTLPSQIRKPHLFPMLPLPFRETLEEYSEEVKKLAMSILNIAADTLKIEREYLQNMFEQGKQALRMNYYPPCPQSDKVIGLSPHSDAVGLTILLQLNETEGLQIRKDGAWIPVKPLPGAFIVNIGDILEMISNGTYKSIEHRAMVNPRKERISVAAFHSPRLDADIGPAPSLVTGETPARFKRINASDFIKGVFSRPLNGKSYIQLMRINHH